MAFVMLNKIKQILVILIFYIPLNSEMVVDNNSTIILNYKIKFDTELSIFITIG